MSKLGPRQGAALLAAAMLTGCMSGRASLLATQGGQGSASGSRDGATSLIGPSRSLASSGNVGSPLAGAGRGASATPAALRISTRLGQIQASANLTAPAPSAGTLRASGGVAASAGRLAAAGQTSLAINPTLAPASSVGASVAAVSQPLNVAAAAQAGSTTAVKSTAKLKAASIGVTVHAGP